MSVGIYKITSPYGGIYIGQSWKINKRWQQHKKYNTSQKLYESMEKYGPQQHVFEVVHELPSDVSQESLNEYEIFYWQKYSDLGLEMLNLKLPGSRGKHSEESKRKMSLRKKGKPVSEITLARLKVSFLGRKHSDETKSKMRASSRRTKHTEETKRIISVAKLGVPSKRRKIIIQYNLDHTPLKEYESITEATRISGVKSINDCLSGRQKKAGGYIWGYKHTKDE